MRNKNATMLRKMTFFGYKYSKSRIISVVFCDFCIAQFFFMA